jgi:hypothetical protein
MPLQIGRKIASARSRMPIPGGRGTTAAMLGIGAIGLTQRNPRASN